MTTVTIKIDRPQNGFTDMHNAIRTLPFGLATEASILRSDNDQILDVVIKGKRRENAFNAATHFMTAFPGTIQAAIEKTNGKERDLLA